MRTTAGHQSSWRHSLEVIPIDAAGAGAGAIMRVVDHAVDHCRRMPGHTDDQATRRKFLRTQMHLAALANEHGGNPIAATPRIVGTTRSTSLVPEEPRSTSIVCHARVRYRIASFRRTVSTLSMPSGLPFNRKVNSSNPNATAS